MPTYAFKNKNSGEVIEKIMKYDDKVKWLEENPEWSSYHGSAAKIVSTVNNESTHTSRARQKHSGWNEVLTGIQKKHPYMKFRD